jgi:hypothetical protein
MAGFRRRQGGRPTACGFVIPGHLTLAGKCYVRGIIVTQETGIFNKKTNRIREYGI